jgi:hypothetical protein
MTCTPATEQSMPLETLGDASVVLPAARDLMIVHDHAQAEDGASNLMAVLPQKTRQIMANSKSVSYMHWSSAHR